MENRNFLDIDWLKKNHEMIHFFGLGFIQLKIDKTHRMHFYNTKYSPIIADDSAHNHRYNFEAEVIHGILNQKLYKFVPSENGIYSKEFESCVKKSERQLDYPPIMGWLEILFETFHLKGSKYKIHHSTFHKIETNINTITLINRPNYYEKEFAEVIYMNGD